MDLCTYGPINLWTYNGPMDLWTYGPMDLWTYAQYEKGNVMIIGSI